MTGVMHDFNWDLINDNTFVSDAHFAAFESTYCEYISSNRGKKLVLCDIPSSISQLNIGPGEALLLPNVLKSCLLPRRAIDKEMRLKELFGHSVCPPVKEIYRPVLIADFLIVPANGGISFDDTSELIVSLTSVAEFTRQILDSI